MGNNLIQVTDSQMNKIYGLLDEQLKKGGLEVLQEVVEVYNALMTAVKVPEPVVQPQEVVQVEKEVQPTPPEEEQPW